MTIRTLLNKPCLRHVTALLHWSQLAPVTPALDLGLLGEQLLERGGHLQLVDQGGAGHPTQAQSAFNLKKPFSRCVKRDTQI